MPKTIGIISIKGGVGKTTIAASLGADLVNHFGKKILLVDANYSAPNLGLHMDILKPEKTIHDVLANKARIRSALHNRFGVDIIPGSYVPNEQFSPLKLKDKLKKVKRDYDFIILDSSPALNEEMLSVILASDMLFVVTTPDYPTLYCSIRAAKLARQRGRPVAGIIINKIRDPKYEVSMKEIEEVTEMPVLARILDDKTSMRSLFTRIPGSLYNRKSNFSREISNLSAALAGKKEKFSLLSRILPSLKREQVNRQIFKENFYKRLFMQQDETR